MRADTLSILIAAHDHVFVRFAVRLELHFALVEPELNSGVQGNQFLISGCPVLCRDCFYRRVHEELCPENAWVYYNLAEAYQNQGDRRNAVENYKLALVAIPDALVMAPEPRGHAKVLISPDAESVGGASTRVVQTK